MVQLVTVQEIDAARIGEISYVKRGRHFYAEVMAVLRWYFTRSVPRGT